MSGSFEFKLNSASAEEITGHLERCDGAFVPPLSTRTDIDAYARKVNSQATRFEAWATGTLVGLVAAYFNRHARSVAFITNVSVEARYRRAGIASALLQQCIDQAVEQGLGGIELDVDNANAAAIDLYRRHGFVAGDASGRSIKMFLRIGRG